LPTWGDSDVRAGVKWLTIIYCPCQQHLSVTATTSVTVFTSTFV
jgi:hypothetical protein